MKTMPAFAERDGKRLALGEKAVSRMHRLGAALAAGVDDLVDDEIALGGRRRPDVDRRVGHLHMKGVLVSVGIDGDRLYSHPPRGLDDSTGDFAAVGDQNALEHAGPRPRNAGPWALRRRAGIVNATLYGFAAYPTKTPGLRGAAGR